MSSLASIVPSFQRNSISMRTILLLVVSFLSSSQCLAGTPREELLRFVPDNVGFCFVLHDLRNHTTALSGSPFMEEFRRSTLGKSLLSSVELLQILKFEEHLKKQLGLDWSKLRDEILGDSLIFVYRPGPPGKPEQEQGLLLLRARDDKLLASLIVKLNEKSKIEEVAHQGISYQRRTEGKEVVFFHLKGPILLITSQENFLREAIDLDRKREPLTISVIAEQLRMLGVDKSFLAVWINPRAWDADLAAKVAIATPTDAARLKQFAIYWKALESAALAMTLEKDVSLSLTLRGSSEQLPAAARRYFAAAAKPCELLRAIPDDALFAISGRFDAPAFLDLIGEFLTDGERRLLHAGLNLSLGSALDKDFVKEILPYLGPDWGFCVIAPPTRDKSWVPISFLAIKVAPGDSTSPADQALYSLVNYLAVGTVFAHNSRYPDQPMKLKTIIKDKNEVKYLESARLPLGLRPAFGLTRGYLLIGSSPESLDRFAKLAVNAPTSLNGEITLVRLSLKDLRLFLNNSREPLTDFFVEQGGTRSEVKRKIEELNISLQLFDRVEVRQRVEANQVTFSLLLQAAQPLRK